MKLKLKLPTRKEIEAFASDPENQAKVMVAGMYITLGMMILGYAIMAYVLFYH